MIKKIMIVFLLFAFIVPASTSSVFAGDNNDSIGATIELLKMIFNKNGKVTLNDVKIFIAKEEKNKGNDVTFLEFYEKKVLNENSYLLSYDGLINEKKAIFVLGLTNTKNETKYIGYLWWDDISNYKKTTKDMFREYFIKYANFDLGVIQNEDSENP